MKKYYTRSPGEKQLKGSARDRDRDHEETEATTRMLDGLLDKKRLRTAAAISTISLLTLTLALTLFAFT